MEIEGEYGGLGIYMANRDGRTTVIAPIEDTPADRAGIKPLDEIIKVDDKTVVGMESNEIVKMLAAASRNAGHAAHTPQGRKQAHPSQDSARGHKDKDRAPRDARAAESHTSS